MQARKPGARSRLRRPRGSTPSKTTRNSADLTVRYHFSERYTDSTTPRPAGPGMVGSYRVAIRDVIHDSVDPDGARGSETDRASTRQAIYAERPSRWASGSASVFSTVRAIEKKSGQARGGVEGVERSGDGRSKADRPDPSQDRRAADSILSLTEGRTLTEYEYDGALPPGLRAAPRRAPADAGRPPGRHLASSPRRPPRHLLGDPSIQGDTLIGKLAEVRKEVDGPRMVASIAITGKVAGTRGRDDRQRRGSLHLPGIDAAQGTFPRSRTAPPRPSDDADGRPGGDHRASPGQRHQRPGARSRSAPVPVESRADDAPPARVPAGGVAPPTYDPRPRRPRPTPG